MTMAQAPEGPLCKGQLGALGGGESCSMKQSECDDSPCSPCQGWQGVRNAKQAAHTALGSKGEGLPYGTVQRPPHMLEKGHIQSLLCQNKGKGGEGTSWGIKELVA